MRQSVKAYLIAFICVTATSFGQVNVATIKPENGTIRKLLQFTGETRPVVEAFAAADVNGPVSQIMIEDGQKVSISQPLGKIDDIRFAITLRQMEAALERSKQQFQEDEKDYQRNKTLFDSKAITQKSLDAALTNLIKGKTTFKQAQADYDKAKLDLDRCVIRSPINGYFVERSIELGQAMARGQNMGRIIDLDDIYVDARIPESEIRNIKEGQTCLVEEKYHGVVAFIDLNADNSRSFKVRIRVKNSDLFFRGNMFVKGQITLEQFDNAPLFPSQAIRNFRGDFFVFTVKNGKAHKQKINIIAQEGEMTYAKEISANDEIITIGQDNLDEDSEVTVRNNGNDNDNQSTNTTNKAEN
ncbi:MAG: efflux RND transporter periplasmic adaptor subunit [Erysipelotrichia bacterium]|nr:efflux RND transporter periplasmic adaptor subunit [Candidatus Riflebacteria bacterium]NCB37701.1 efflux RND transporter periplasmic adaptor subunit [Erysipelotrichia bacterium]